MTEKNRVQIARILNDPWLNECIRLLTFLRDVREGESYAQPFGREILKSPVRLVEMLGNVDGLAQALTQQAVDAFGVVPYWCDEAKSRYSQKRSLNDSWDGREGIGSQY